MGGENSNGLWEKKICRADGDIGGEIEKLTGGWREL